MALIETIPLLVIFVMFLSYAMGFFGAVHTACLNSISARAYAYETFRNRTNLNYFREDGSALTKQPLYLGNKGFRYHAVNTEIDDRPSFIATTRQISIGKSAPQAAAKEPTHNQDIYSILRRNEKVEVSPIWVMVGYGICLNASCGS